MPTDGESTEREMNRRTFLRSASATALMAGPVAATAQVFFPGTMPRVSRPLAVKEGIAAKGAPPASTWFTDLPRGSFGHVKIGDEVFILGGHLGRYHCYLPHLFTDQFLAYNVKSKTWRKLPYYPVPVESPTLIAVGSSILAFGGYRYDAAFHYVDCAVDANGNTEQANDTYSARSDDRIYRFDSTVGNWQLYGHMPHRRSSGVAFARNGKVYLLAGWDGTPSIRKDRKGKFHSSVEVLDLASGTFEHNDLQLTAPPRRALSSADVNGTSVLVGGLSDTGMPLANVTMFDPASGKFSDLIPLKERRFAPGACFTGRWLVVAGGLDFMGGGLTNSVAYCDPAGGGWIGNGDNLEQPSMFVELEPLDANTVLAIGAYGEANPYPLVQEIKIG